MSDNFCYREVGRTITKWEVIENRTILLSQYWINEEFDSALKIVI